MSNNQTTNFYEQILENLEEQVSLNKSLIEKIKYLENEIVQIKKYIA